MFSSNRLEDVYKTNRIRVGEKTMYSICPRLAAIGLRRFHLVFHRGRRLW